VLRALGGVPAMKQTRIYPLAQADDPEKNEWIGWTDLTFSTVHANDFSFYEEVKELVQEEPDEAFDPERAGQLAAIGIVHGEPFEPDEPHAGHPRADGEGRRVQGARSRASLYGSWKGAFGATAASSCAAARGCSSRALGSTTSPR
jgi:hypothetical protein